MSVFSIFSGGDNRSEESRSLLRTIRQVIDVWSGAASGSLIDYTRMTRVEPICMVDKTLIYNDSTEEVMNSLQSIFTAYYLQAALISINVGRVEVMRHLDKLNPNRAPMDSLADGAGYVLATEDLKHALPMNFSMEAVGARADDGHRSGAAGRKISDEITALTNLSVGKIVSLEIKDGENAAEIPVTIRLIAASLEPDNLVHILSSDAEELRTVKERWRGWRSGRLEFIKDIMFCQDLIDARREKMVKDRSGLYDSIIARGRSNRIAGILSANPSIATASNLCVISKANLEKVESQINAKLSNPKTREKVFESSYLMIMAVVDTEWERVTFYHRGISDATEMSLKQLKTANKGKGPDIADILSAYQLGKAPNL